MEANGNAKVDREPSGPVTNPYVLDLEKDHLYHLNLSTENNLKAMFSDVKFVCMGGTPSRMKKFAEYFAEVLDLPQKGKELENLTNSVDRYVIYKAGPVLTASHGVGVPSMSILLIELFKLLHHAGAKDVEFFRLGTSGGLGLQPGSVVITSEALNGGLEPYHEMYILGKAVKRPATLNGALREDIINSQPSDRGYEVIPGKTMCANDFYEGQGRVDGAICGYTKKDKVDFLTHLHKLGVRNIEMECVGFADYTHQVGIRGAIVCVTIVNRMINDQITEGKEMLKQFEMRPAMVVANYFKRKIAQK